MKRIFIIGLLLVTWAVLLIAGCGGDEKQEAATQVAADDGSKKTLNIYMWPDIVDPELIKAFEKQNNCRINYDVISNNEELLAKMQAGGAQYDLIQPSDYMVEIMIKLKMLDKLNLDNIPNKKHLVPFLQNPAYDPTGEYVVPYTWGFTGIVYNKKYVKKAPTSLADLWDPDYKNRLILLNDSREVLGMALKKNGFSNNSTKQEEIDIAVKDLQKLMDNVMAFDTDTIKQKMIAEEAWIGIMWSGDASFVIQDNKDIGYVVPKEGGVIWADNLAIPKTCKNKALAEKFINFIFEPKNSAQNFEYIGYDETNMEAMQYHDEEFRNNPVLKEARDHADRGEWLKDIGEHVTMYDRAWTELKSGM